MTVHPTPLACSLAALVAAAGCDTSNEAGRRTPNTFEAKGVEVQMPIEGDAGLTATGDRLVRERGGSVLLTGNAALSVEGPLGMRARADAIRLDESGIVTLEGSVRATMEVPGEPDIEDLTAGAP